MNDARAGERWQRSRAPDERADQIRRMVLTVLGEPFQSRTWAELAFLVLSGVVSAVGILLVAVSLLAGPVLAVVMAGVLLLAAGLHGVRGVAVWQRALARHFLAAQIEDPDPFRSEPGLLRWLGASLRDRAAWRAVVYFVARTPLLIFGGWFFVRIWGQGLLAVIHGVSGVGVVTRPGRFPADLVLPSYGAAGPPANRLGLLVAGALTLLVAPWGTRLLVMIDRALIAALLGPDALTARVRTLERARTRTVDASAATLRRIERDLHDGTQAQLVALAMRLGQVKEELAGGEPPDLESIRRLVDEAHRGAKEAIVELRDLARGIHPPVLDTGLEAALATLAARSPVPTELQVSMRSRPSSAIAAISYFCVAELLANVAQHARAGRASIQCGEHGRWLRIVARDDGRGGAAIHRTGSSSSGLAGLEDRVGSVDGVLTIASPVGGPTVVVVDLPLRA